MPEISIRPAVATDIKHLMALDHACESDYVMQLDFLKDAEQSSLAFRRMRLPRTVHVYYPRPVLSLADNWSRTTLMLSALIEGQPIAYLRLTDQLAAEALWITDLVVAREMRRQGIATALILAAQKWGLDRKMSRAFLEMTTKNHAVISLAYKLGFELCGYNDMYYPSRDIALFFGRTLK